VYCDGDPDVKNRNKKRHRKCILPPLRAVFLPLCSVIGYRIILKTGIIFSEGWHSRAQRGRGNIGTIPMVVPMVSALYYTVYLQYIISVLGEKSVENTVLYSLQRKCYLY
jgi:hypothetical protein